MARYWGKNLKIDGSILTEAPGMLSGEALAWEAQVQDVCRLIETKSAIGTGKPNVTGKLLMELILKCSGKNITILPLSAANLEKTAAKAVDWSKGMKEGYRFHCPTDQFCSSSPSTGSATTPHSDLLKGSGGGSDVRLYFHPASWTSHDQMKGLDTVQDNFQPDDVLFHELFHAYRFMMGLFEEVPTGDTWEYSEEAYAIIATNVYVSETRGGTDSLRGDHNLKFQKLERQPGGFHGDPLNSKDFYLDNAQFVDVLIREMPQFTTPLEKDGAQRVASWNPFRGRIEHEKALQMFSTVGDKWDMMSRP